MSGRFINAIGKNGRFYSTVDNQEMVHFTKYVDVWWNEFGAFKGLHSMNKLRIPWVRDSLVKLSDVKNPVLPLNNISILDVGCGGGILSEPLAKIGANVTGLDANEEIINSAKSHAKLQNLRINYVAATIEDHSKENRDKYDAIVASEVIEHITEKSKFVEACIKCLKPNGSIFFTTLNKTWRSNFFGIFVAETLLNGLPKGTHHYDKFIEPHLLQRMLEENNCRTEVINGLFYNYLTNKWTWTTDLSLSYGLKAIKV